jgi:hypothetical protein
MPERSSKAATRQSWPNIKALPEQRATLSIERVFTEEDYGLIRQGVIPEAMEDKGDLGLRGSCSPADGEPRRAAIGVRYHPARGS